MKNPLEIDELRRRMETRRVSREPAGRNLEELGFWISEARDRRRIRPENRKPGGGLNQAVSSIHGVNARRFVPTGGRHTP